MTNCIHCGTEMNYDYSQNAYICPNAYCPYNLSARISTLEQSFARILNLMEKMMETADKHANL